MTTPSNPQMTIEKLRRQLQIARITIDTARDAISLGDKYDEVEAIRAIDKARLEIQAIDTAPSKHLKCDCGYGNQGHVGEHLSGCPEDKPLKPRAREFRAPLSDLEAMTKANWHDPLTKGVIIVREVLSDGS